MGRSPCCEKTHTNKGAWTKEEDQLLVNHINLHGEGNWRSLPKAAGLHRCGKSCRLRWINYLRPDLKRGNFTAEEDEIIIRLHTFLGNKWSLIAGRLPGRTDNEIKNYWNTHIRRKLINSGIDPQTHRPLNSAATPPPKEEIISMNDPTKFLSLSNSSSVQDTNCNSTTTEESHPPPPPHREDENAADELDLQLSIGLPSQAKYEKSASFNSSSSSAETPFKAAAEVVAPPMCMCPPFGLRKDQWCSNCRSRNGLFRY